jgi:DNA/RNA endonuclease G (NUC1)
VRHAMRFALAAVAVGLSIGPAHPQAGFTPGPKNDPATCKNLWEAIGLPKYQDTGHDATSTAVCHTRYVLSHNNPQKIPAWVIEHLTVAQVSGTNSRPSIPFKPDEFLPVTARATDDDYRGNPFGYDRGHQAPSEDFNQDEDLMKETFLFSNIVPQEGKGFNQGVWKKLEEHVRKLAVDRKELYVITGPIDPDVRRRTLHITAAANSCGKAIDLAPLSETTICGKDKDAKCPAGVTVPIALYKIIYDPRMKRANAFVFPNIDHRPFIKKTNMLSYIEGFRTSVSIVEQFTGIDFLTSLSTRDRRIQVEQCAAMMLH